MRAAEPHAADSAGPLTDPEIDLLFAALGGVKRLAVAVSGGADSLALMLAADRWRGRAPGRSVVVLTVDHRLRKGSRREAMFVARIARARGLDSRILTRAGAAPESDIEAAARAARYRLLFAACREEGATHLAVAHHRDDVAETFLLRLKRGAGVFGLAAMRPSLTVGDVTLVRPFLSVSRERLAATTRAAGLKPVVDAMNADPRFDRARVRRLLPLLSGEGLDPAMIAATALRLAESADALDAAATRLIADAVEADALAVAWLDPKRLGTAPGEVAMRALARILLAVGGDDYPPRRERLAALMAALAAHPGDGRFKRTLAGVVIEFRGGRFALYREAGRQALPTLKITFGVATAWDHRFQVEAGARVPAGLTIGPLGAAGVREIGADAGDHPAGAFATLPALRQRGQIIGVPPLGWWKKSVPVTVAPILGDRLSRPPLFPDTGFVL